MRQLKRNGSSTQTLVVISPSNFPGTTGDTTNYLELIKGFGRRGIGVVLVCPKHPDSRAFDGNMKRQGIKVVRILFDPPRLKDFEMDRIFLHVLKLMAFYILEIMTVSYVLLRERSKFCFVRYGVLTFPILPLGQILNVKCICDVYELPTSVSSARFSSFLGKIAYILDKKLLPLNTGFRIMNYENLSLLCELGVPRNRIFICLPGIDLVNKLPTVDLNDIPPATFGFFGVLEKWQGVDTLIRAFVEVVKVCKDAKLYIIGEGSLESDLKKIVKKQRLSDNVIFNHPVPRDVLMREYLPKFRVLVISRPQTTSSSLVPMKLIESLAAGKVVITTPIKTIECLLKSCAVVTPSSDAQTLARMMLKVIQDEGLQLKLSCKAKEVAKYFDINNTVDDVLYAFEKFGCR